MKKTDPFNRKKQKPFEAPQSYFEVFPSKLQSAIQEKVAAPTWWERIKPILEGRFTITTSVVAVLVVIILSLTNSNQPVEINEAEAYAYLTELESDELNEYLIVDYMDEIPAVIVEPSEEEILEYLLDQEYIENEIY